MTVIALDEAKAALRRRMRAERAAARRADPGAAEAAARRLDEARLPPFATAAGYAPAGAEMDPGPVLRRLAAGGARIALPVAVRAEAPLVFRLWREGDPLAPDAAGVPAPTEAAEAVRPDLVLTPLLAFDRAGRRLGQGGGYYDRTLAALRAEAPVFALGLGYAVQEVEAVPAGPADQRLDAVLTERGCFPVEGEPA